MKRKDRSATLALVLLALLTLILYRNVVFRPGVIYGKDTVVQGYPFSYYMAQNGNRDTNPIWIPNMLSGFPTTPAFYPGDIVKHIMPASRSMTWRYVIHTFAGAALMFLMLRKFRRSNTASIIGGIAFGFSAFFIAKIYAGHGFAIFSGIWIPLTILLLDKTLETKQFRFAAFTGASLGLQILGKHPQYVFYTLIGMVIYTVWTLYHLAGKGERIKTGLNYAALAAVAGLFTFMISAHHLLPFMELTRLSNRGGGTGYEYATSLSMHPAQLITTVVPSFMGHPERHNTVFGALYWDGAIYIGLIPFILAVIALFLVKDRRAACFKAIAIASIIIALGSYTPLYKVLYHIPGFSMVRAPSKALFLYAFAAAALAGYGWDLLVSSAPRLHPRVTRASVDMIAGEPLKAAQGIRNMWTKIFWLLAATTVLWVASQSFIMEHAAKMIRDTRPDAPAVISKLSGLMALQTHGLFWALGFTAIGAVVVVLLMKRLMSSRSAALVMVTVTALDLIMFASPFFYTVDGRKELSVDADKDAIKIMQSDHSTFRVLPTDASIFPYAQGLMDGIENVNGYYPISIKRYAVYVGAAEKKQSYVDVSADISSPKSPLIDWLNVRYVLSPKPIQDKKLEEIHVGKSHLYRNTQAFPRVFVVHNAVRVDTEEKALVEITRKGFDPCTTAVIESGQPIPKASGKPITGTAEIIKRTPTELHISTNQDSAGYLMASEVYYPDWKATIDGKETKLYPGNYLFRAVYVPEGKHLVVMRLQSRKFAIGSGLTIASVLVLLGLMVTYRRPRNE